MAFFHVMIFWLMMTMFLIATLYLFFLSNFSRVIFNLVSCRTIDLPTAITYRLLYNYWIIELKLLDCIYTHKESLGCEPPEAIFSLLAFWFFYFSCCSKWNTFNLNCSLNLWSIMGQNTQSFAICLYIWIIW